MSVLVSAIIPTHNRARLVVEAIRGALAQRLPGGDVEVIVVDDESTDNTPEVVRTFPSVRYLRQPNRREAAARNLGARHANGVYLAFVDDDDFWLPDKLANDVARFEQPDAPALVYSRAANVDLDGRNLGVRQLPVFEGDVFWHLAREAFMPMSSVAVRASAFRACGGFAEDLDLSGSADWELWMRLAARGPVGFVDQTRTCVRVHTQHMLADPSYMERAMLAAVRHALADPQVSRRAGRRANYIRACMYVTIALNAYGNGRRVRSLAWLTRAIATWPALLGDARVWGGVARLSLGRQRVRALRQIARKAAV
ncbi:MAG: glycosyltransferase family 2 protein [Chloroflexi bacterium]|nr:glycosyltransferase family 2 protein [Chloroflexota bacterium]